MISWFEKHSKVSWAITILGAIAIFVLSSLTFEGAGTGGKSLLPMLYHILAFFSFTFFLLISMVKGENKSLLLPAAIISILYGISDEFHQFFVPGRFSSGFDIFLDSLGTMFALMIYLVSLESRKSKNTY